MNDGKAILLEVLAYTKESINSLSEKIGLKRSQNLYDIKSGKVKKISSELSEKICQAYPSLNREYLLTGEGELISKNNKSKEYDIHDLESMVSEYKEKYYNALEEIRELNKRLRDKGSPTNNLKKAK